MTAVDETVTATAASDPARPELPPSLGERIRSFGLGLGIELRPGRVLVAVVVLAFVAAAGWWLVRPPPSTAPEVTLPRAGASTGVTATSLATAPAEAVVHAAGAVVSPGLYRLEPGARVADVIDAAGGPTAEADLDQLNLAAKVADGERVYVPREGESVPAPVGDGSGSTGAPRLVDINTASVADLDALPGIGPAIAQAIVDHRTRHGPFRSVDDLLEVRGIGDAKLAELRDRVTVG